MGGSIPVLVLLDAQEWTEGSRGLGDWLGWAGHLAAALLGLCLLALFLRGLAQRSRYSAGGMFDESARDALSEEIAAAERSTEGEVVVVVLERSDRHPASHWIAGCVTLLLGSAIAAPWMPWGSPVLFFLLQVLFGAVGAAAALVSPGFRRAFVTEERATELAREQAFQEFYRHGLHRTAGETGVLLFVSLFERRVIVLGDRGVDAKVEAEDWQHVDEAVLAGIRAGSLRQGLSKALEEVAAVLTKHFPVGDAPQGQVPDHVVVRRE